MIKKITEIGAVRMILIASGLAKAEASTNAMRKLLLMTAPLLASRHMAVISLFSCLR